MNAHTPNEFQYLNWSGNFNGHREMFTSKVLTLLSQLMFKPTKNSSEKSKRSMELINWQIPTRHPPIMSRKHTPNCPLIVVAIALHSHLMPKITKQFRPPTMRWRNKHIFMQKLWCLGSRERRWEKYPFRMRKESLLEVFSMPLLW